jgi:uncharacterized protein (DUF433 family)
MDSAQTKARAVQLLGVGLYTAADASALIGVPTSKVRRWLLGYDHGKPDASDKSEPLWTSQLPRLGREVELGFRDLMEMRCVAALLSQGISLHAIRKAILKGREVIGNDHPLSSVRFKTDGRTVFLQVSTELDEPALFDLMKNQWTFNWVMAPSFRDVDFDGDDPGQWWPMTRKSKVLIDPRRNFGRPIEATHGVPTRAIAEAVKAEGSEAKAAQIFDLSLRSVLDAVAFECRAA